MLVCCTIVCRTGYTYVYLNAATVSPSHQGSGSERHNRTLSELHFWCETNTLNTLAWQASRRNLIVGRD